MIDTEMARYLINRKYFRLNNEEGGILREKLIYLSHMLIEMDEDAAMSKEKEFSVYMGNDGLIYTDKGMSCTSSWNIECEEEGWSWCKITGPYDSMEYYNNRFFDRRDTTCIELAYTLYFIILRFKPCEVARTIIKCFLDCKTWDEVCDILDQMVDNEFDLEVLRDRFESNVVETEMCTKTLLLCAYYLYHRINGSTMETDLQEIMNVYFREYFPDESLDGEDYLEFFLGILDESLDCSEEGKCLMRDLLLNVHFSYATDDKEKTPTLFFFKSEPLKEYKEMRERYKEEEAVKYLDLLVPMLEDPAFMFPGEELFTFRMEPESCVVEYGYTSKEYICCYYYYERGWGENKEYVNYDYAFSLARKCFEVLFNELKQLEVNNMQ